MIKIVIKITLLLFIVEYSFCQNESVYDTKTNYQISSEKYITDINGNIRMNINVWGHVNIPGGHQVFAGIDMVTLLSIVGGPKIGADMKKITILREIPDENGRLVYSINFDNFLKSGDRSDFIKIKPNDTIIINQKLTNLIFSQLASINTVLSLITLYIQISNAF